MNKWQRKLLAFLHDPPHKALDIQGHEQARNTFITQAGFDSAAAIQWMDKQADWWASAADRFAAFDSRLQSPFGGADHPFKHPLGGSELDIPEFPTPEQLGETIQTVQPHGSGLLDAFKDDERDRVNFFLHWRRWPVEAAQKDWRSAFQPADTRLPDHPIWLHNSVTSALQGCDGKPAFLMLQLGPVQEFIAQARSTRDLWSGSYLLSWLVAHAIKAVTDTCGPDAVIYPFLRAQPLFDLLHRDIYEKIPFGTDTMWTRLKQHEREMLVPNFPNKFLAVVPSEQAAELAQAAAKAAQVELVRIAGASWNWIHERHPLQDSWRSRFDLQIGQFLQITWQTLPWEDFQSLEKHRPQNSRDWKSVDYVLDKFAAFGGKAAKDLKEIRKLGSPYEWNTGFVWPYHYAQADRLLAARRNTRDFDPWMLDEKGRPLDEHLVGTPKDTFSGKEEIIGSEKWWEDAREHNELRFVFRSSDRLGAVNLVKKVWHKAYLAQKDGWNLDVRKVLDFESVPGVAAGWWRKQLVAKMQNDGAIWSSFVALIPEIEKAAPAVGLEIRHPENERKFVEQNDPEIFFAETWREACPEVARQIAKFLDSSHLSAPPKYVAVLALDGDEMGKWMSGEKTPPLTGQFSKEACDKFGAPMKDVNRPLSPSYHLQFSEALANFSLYLARPVVEHFGGQLIYAGGDDVLAMVPAAQALDCAEALRAGFQGQKRLEQLVPGRFEVQGTNGGFIELKQPKAEQPSWRLIVPGPRADVSCGIAIGHIKSPLQGLVRAAQEAEKRAKKKTEQGGLGRSAFAVTIYKRSGETMEWGAKWKSGALELYRAFLARTLSGDVFGKFAYALDELIGPYRNDGALKDAEGFDIKAVIPLELERVLDRQITSKEQKKKKDIAEELRGRGRVYLAALPASRAAQDFPQLFKTAAFIHRGERE